jgi:hypothetical protein
MRRARFVLPLAVVCLFAFTVQAQTDPAISSHTTGALRLPDQANRLFTNFARPTLVDRFRPVFVNYRAWLTPGFTSTTREQLNPFRRVAPQFNMSRAERFAVLPQRATAQMSRLSWAQPRVSRRVPLAFSCPSGATCWVGGASGNWSSAGNWSNSVPSGNNVLIDNNNANGQGASTVTEDATSTINNLTVDSDDKLTMNSANNTLTVNGGTISNAGTITINGGGGANSILNLGASTALSGGGTLNLSTTASGGGSAYIQGNGTTLTNSETIQGEGVIGNGSLALNNQLGGVIDANSTGGGLISSLVLNGSGNITNAGTLEATNSGVLVINNGVTVNNSGGNITANGANAAVQFTAGADIQGGTLNTLNGGFLGTPGGTTSTLDGSTHGAVTLSSGSAYTTEGGNDQTNILGSIINKGNFQVNGGGGANGILNLSGNTTLSGGGTVTLSTQNSGGGSAYIQGSGFTLNNTNNTIQGEGVIGNGTLALSNAGIVDANVSGFGLVLNGSGGVTNTNLLEATNGGFLQLSGITVNNAGGNITANGGTVQLLANTVVQGGTLNSLNGGTLVTPAGNTVTLDGSTASGAITLSSGSTYTEAGGNSQTNVLGSIINNGTFVVDGGGAANGFLNLNASTTISGGGTVTLSTNSSGGGSAYIQGNSKTLTNTDNTIQGDGIIGNGSLALNNAGTVDANVSGGGLLLNGSGGVTNTNLLEATGGGFLQLLGLTVNNAGGNISANGGTVQLLGSTVVQGGTLNSVNGGTLVTPSNNTVTLDGSTHGALTLSSGSTYTEAGGNSQTNILGTITNNGTFVVDGGGAANGLLNLNNNTTLGGSGGKITLFTQSSGGGNAYIQGNGMTLTNTNNTIQGEGIIGNGSLALVNQSGGVIDANSTGSGAISSLSLNGSGNITNAGLLEATNNGVLAINGIVVNNSGGNITANGSNAQVQFSGGADIQGGTLNTKSGGSMVTPGGTTVTLDGKTHGALTLSAGSTYTTAGGNDQTNILGTVNNNGTFVVDGGGAANGFLNLTGNTTLQGTGKGVVTLSTQNSGGGSAYIQGNGMTLTNTNNTIQGEGVIGNGTLSLINGSKGTIFANVSGFTLLLNGSGTITNNGTFKVATGSLLHVQNGPFTNFSGTTLTGGTYNITGTAQAGTLQIDELGSTGGEIVTNSANIILSGPFSAFVDASGHDALSAFNTNSTKGSFTINSGRNFTTAGNFTNNGTLTVGSSNSTFVVSGNLTNFSGTTLTGGTYNVTGTLQFNGANIVTNAAKITLSGPSWKIVDQSAHNGLAAFASNSSTGTFGLASGAKFTTAGNFANSGTLSFATGTTFTVGGPGVLTQTAGKTTDDGTVTDSGGFNLNGGSLFGKGTVAGNLTDSTGTITPGDSSTMTGILKGTGTYTQGSNGVLDIAIGGINPGTQFDQLNITGAATLNGTLNITRLHGYVPPIGQQFKIVNFASATGTFVNVTGLGINSSEHFTITYPGTDVLLTVVAGAAPQTPSSRLHANRRTNPQAFVSIAPVSGKGFGVPAGLTYGSRAFRAQSSRASQHFVNRTRPMIGSFSWDLSHLLTKPKFKFAVE